MSFNWEILARVHEKPMAVTISAAKTWRLKAIVRDGKWIIRIRQA